MATRPQLLRLKKALQAHRQASEELESALLEIETTLPDDGPPPEPPGHQDLQLLSIVEVCRTLGMGKSWTYRKLKSGEIPSVKLGRSIKIRRDDLEDYLESRRYRPTDEQ